MASGTGALTGAALGAQAGSSFGPWGTAIGTGVGGLAGAFGLGSKKAIGPSYYDLLDQRNREMQDFTNRLALNRANYIQSMQNLNKTVMSQFAPNLESTYGARGLNVTGGAYQSELARQSATLGAQANVDAAKMGQQDITSVMNFGGNPMSLGNPYGEASYKSDLTREGASGQLLGTALSSLIKPNGTNGQNTIGQIGSSLASLFGRSPVNAGTGQMPLPGFGSGYKY